MIALTTAPGLTQRHFAVGRDAPYRYSADNDTISIAKTIGHGDTATNAMVASFARDTHGGRVTINARTIRRNTPPKHVNASVSAWRCQNVRFSSAPETRLSAAISPRMARIELHA